MSTFATAMRESANLVKGENGALMHASSGSARVNAFSLLVQTSDEASVKKMIRDMFSEFDTCTDTEVRNQIIHDIFVLAFHKRGTSKMSGDTEVSDGEGCKNIFYIYIL